jgi:kumamolisin
MRVRHYAHLHPDPHAATSWRIADLLGHYRWPSGLRGGARIGVYEAGGDLITSDLAANLAANGISGMPMIVNSVSPFRSDPRGANVEVQLDVVEICVGYFKATGTLPMIVMIWDQVGDITSGIVAAKGQCEILSISWGAPEDQWLAQDPNSLTALEAAIVAFGGPVLCASGDAGDSDGEGGLHVDAPASAPGAIGCGGTTLPPGGGAETAWSGAGGGYSAFFPFVAAAQPGAPAGKGRMVPDVCACADPNTGVQLIVGGKAEVVGGTSRVSPSYAGLLAALNADATALAKFWANQADFTDIKSGSNGLPAAPGPDPAGTGIGSPIGTAIATTFAGIAPPGPTPTPTPTPTPAPTPTPPPPPPGSQRPTDPIWAAIYDCQVYLNGLGEVLRTDGSLDVRTAWAIHVYQGNNSPN